MARVLGGYDMGSCQTINISTEIESYLRNGILISKFPIFMSLMLGNMVECAFLKIGIHVLLNEKGY